MKYERLPNRPLNFASLNKGRPHVSARQKINEKLIKMAQAERGIQTFMRYPVPDSKVDWDVDFPDYAPLFLDIPRGESSFRKKGDRSDPSDPKSIRHFSSLEVGEVRRDPNGLPLNPMGRTGLWGRGMLDKWGATQAADPLLTRNGPDSGKLEVLLIQRGDNGEWALPGGKVDDGEEPWQAAARELVEEAGVHGVDLDFSTARTVYAGYIDDSRNTDNAWMESTALHLHLTPEQARAATVRAGSDAEATEWAVVSDDLYPRLFGSHGGIVRLAVSEALLR